MDWTLQHVYEEFNTNLSAAANPSIKLQLRNSQMFTTTYQIIMQEVGKKRKERQRDLSTAVQFIIFFALKWYFFFLLCM